MKRIPLLSLVLGGMAPTPLIIMTLIIMLYSSKASLPSFLPSFVGYAGILLAFIGGVNWLMTTHQPVILLEDNNSKIDIKRLFITFITVVAGEAAIISNSNNNATFALLILMAGFWVALFYERNAYLPNELPVGYATIRKMTTAIIQFCLICVLIKQMF